MQLHQSLIRVGNSSYILNKTCYSEFLDSDSKIESMKQWTKSDIVFSNGLQNFFCSNIDELDVSDEIISSESRDMITEFKVVNSEIAVEEAIENTNKD